MEFNEIVGLRLRNKRKEKDLSMKELGERVGLSEATIQRYETGQIKGVDINLINAFAKTLGTTSAYLMGWTDEEYSPKKKGVKIPVLGRVAAGIPIEMIEDVIDTEEITEDMARRGNYFALKITGDSMTPRIWDGDVVIVREQSDADSGEIIVATVNGDDAVCKKLQKYDGGIALVSLNPIYDPIYFTNAEIIKEPVIILGKVVELRGKF